MGSVDPVPEELRGVLGAVLNGLDPRLSPDERAACLLAATEQDPDYVVGVLSEMVFTHLRRSERIRQLPQGTLIDQMISERLPVQHLPVLQPPHRDGDQRLTSTGQLQEWGQGMWHDVDEPPAPVHLTRADGDAVQAFAAALHDVPPPPRVWTVEDAARVAEETRRARLDAELAAGGVNQGAGYPSHQTGGQSGSEPLSTPNVDPRVKALLERHLQERRDLAAIDAADLDDPATMPAAMTAALDVTQLDDPPSRVTTPYGHNDQTITCSHPTSAGPCRLTAGHPLLDVPGTENGHIAEETSL